MRPELVDGRGPELPPAAATRAQQMRLDRVPATSRAAGQALESLVLPDGVLEYDDDNSRRDPEPGQEDAEPAPVSQPGRNEPGGRRCRERHEDAHNGKRRRRAVTVADRRGAVERDVDE